MKGKEKAIGRSLLLLGAALACGTTPTTQGVEGPRNFIYFGVERSRISEAGFLETGSIVGAQLKYRWPELEPEHDRYDLQPILDDLAFLQQHGKALFVQLQDVSFEGTRGFHFERCQGSSIFQRFFRALV